MHEEVLTQTLDLDLVRHVREHGTLGLNQILKQLRDFDAGGGAFPPYTKGLAKGEGLCHLSPLGVQESMKDSGGRT
jgi:hypothetical protein